MPLTIAALQPLIEFDGAKIGYFPENNKYFGLK